MKLKEVIKAIVDCPGIKKKNVASIHIGISMVFECFRMVLIFFTWRITLPKSPILYRISSSIVAPMGKEYTMNGLGMSTNWPDG